MISVSTQRVALRLNLLLLIVLPLSRPGQLEAQTKQPSTSPVPLVPAPGADPIVHPDNSVTFDLRMPHAEHVELQVEGFAKPFVMQQNAASAEPGHWTYTVPPLAPEYYSYSFVVDGTNVVDPHDVTVKTSAFRVESLFLVPGASTRAMGSHGRARHGTVSHHQYTSPIVKRVGSYFVYTPPGYDPKAKKKYPVLYLLHGYSDEDDAWTSMGKANLILDNLIAQGKAQPMIVVMPLGYGDMDMIKRGWVAWQDKDLVVRNFRLFGEALYQEIMPRVNAEYPILPKREDHAIAGLSMGGAETLLVGLNHTDDFAWIGAFSAGGHRLNRLPCPVPRHQPAVRAQDQRRDAVALDLRRHRRWPARTQPGIHRMAARAGHSAQGRGDAGHARLDGVAGKPGPLRAAAVSSEAVAQLRPRPAWHGSTLSLDNVCLEEQSSGVNMFISGTPKVYRSTA